MMATTCPIKQVANIEARIFGDSGLTQKDLKRLMQKTTTYDVILYHQPDGEDTGEVSAYAISEMVEGAEDGKDYCLLHRFVVAEKHRRRGAGKLLWDTIKCDSALMRCYCPERWADSISWFRHTGWKAVGVDRGHYGNQDAIIFERGPVDAKGQ